MQTTLQSEIDIILKQFPEYWENEELLKHKVIEDLRNYKEVLINALISNELVRETYSIQTGEHNVFKLEDFISMLRFKNYWQNSYTRYSNEIGLTSEEKYLKYNTDVVLDFPYKDTVLEGGMTKEEVGIDEVFFHNVLAKEEVDVLFSSKVLADIKKFDSNGEHEITEITEDDNLIIKGNNLIALHTLKERFSGKVKLIYIDPPFNTGNDSFKYNDRFNRSTWLTFMKNRLEVAKELLSENGIIFIEIDKNEDTYLKVLMDEIFGENNFINSVTVQSSTASGNKTAHKDKTIIKTKDTILVYKNKGTVEFYPQYISQDKWDTHFNSILVGNENDYKSVPLRDYLIEPIS